MIWLIMIEITWNVLYKQRSQSSISDQFYSIQAIFTSIPQIYSSDRYNRYVILFYGVSILENISLSWKSKKNITQLSYRLSLSKWHLRTSISDFYWVGITVKMATVLQRAALSYIKNQARASSHSATAGGHGGKQYNYCIFGIM